MPKHIENTGFRPPASRLLGQEHRSVAFAQLVTTLALVLATMAVATVLSASAARAAATIQDGASAAVWPAHLAAPL